MATRSRLGKAIGDSEPEKRCGDNTFGWASSPDAGGRSLIDFPCEREPSRLRGSDHWFAGPSDRHLRPRRPAGHRDRGRHVLTGRAAATGAGAGHLAGGQPCDVAAGAAAGDGPRTGRGQAWSWRRHLRRHGVVGGGRARGGPQDPGGGAAEDAGALRLPLPGRGDDRPRGGRASYTGRRLAAARRARRLPGRGGDGRRACGRPPAARPRHGGGTQPAPDRRSART